MFRWYSQTKVYYDLLTMILAKLNSDNISIGKLSVCNGIQNVVLIYSYSYIHRDTDY